MKSQTVNGTHNENEIFDLPVYAVKPATVNGQIYRPVTAEDPGIQKLAESIEKIGQEQPIGISLDNVIYDGHRRHMACKVAGLRTVRCRRKAILSTDPAFVELLVACNEQRVKTAEEIVREQLVMIDPEEAHQELLAHRRRRERTNLTGTYKIVGQMRRAKISDAKLPFLNAIQDILEEREEFWPLTVRQIHYALLNNPPLIHASKPDSVYRNNRASYKALSDLATRGRLDGDIDWEAIHDPTRQLIIWNVHSSPQPFVAAEMEGFLKGYYRDLQLTQPNHIEIVIEKATAENIVRPVAAHYCIPVTPERGQCSLPPRYLLAERFRNSGKGKLIVLILGDFDPDGESIVNAFCKSLRDDFDIPTKKLEVIWVALTHAQTQQMVLPQALPGKKTSSNYKKFVAKYGSSDTYELEAVEPATLQRILRNAIESVIDQKAFAAEKEQEKKDWLELEAIRRHFKSLEF